MASQRPVGTITRGTTNPNRLRRVDRWLAGPQGWRLRRPVAAPVVVDLGYGASPVTAVELHARLRRVRADTEVVGIEIDPARVRAARPLEREGLTFLVGGFEVPLPGGAAPTVVRAFNVLRQYDEGEVAGAWATVRQRLAPGGLLVDGTCDELGRRSTWVAVEADGPRSLSLSLRLSGAAAPLGRGRAAAQGADPPQRARRAHPRLPHRAGRGVGEAGAARVVRRAAAVPRHGVGGARRGVAAAGRAVALAAGRADRGLVGVAPR